MITINDTRKAAPMAVVGNMHYAATFSHQDNIFMVVGFDLEVDKVEAVNFETGRVQLIDKLQRVELVDIELTVKAKS